MNVLLEVCIDCMDSALAARKGGADRLEVCSSLSAGGTTPSAGLVEQCIEQVGMPVMMMIRPHDGGFVYDEADLTTMLEDIRIGKQLGVQGFVFGALLADHTLDQTACQQLLEAAQPLETTFHRAFDVATEPLAMLEQIQELGFTRLLTSGQAVSAVQGAALIAKLRAKAADEFHILAGAGVDADNVLDLVQQTNITEVHASASRARDDGQVLGCVQFGTDSRITDAEHVRAIRQALNALL